MRFPPVCCALMLLACTTLSGQALYVPPELARAPRVSVDGRPDWKPGHTVRFAEYSAERSASHWEEAPTGPGSETLGFRVGIKGRGGWRGDCAPVTVQRKEMPAQASDLRCRLTPESGDTSQVWRLEVFTAKGKMPSGKLIRGRARLEIVGTNNLADGETTSGDRPAGFHFLVQGQALAAVELFGDGAVILDTGLPGDRRDLFAVSAAALMLWDDLVYPPR